MAALRDLTISIVSHGHGHLLDELLGDLDRAGALDQCRTIVTMNIVDSRSPATNWQSTKVEWIYNDYPKGFGANHNYALRNARTAWLLVLNPDIRLPGNALELLLAEAPNHPDVGVIAPRIVSTNGETEDSVRQNLSPASLMRRWSRRLLGVPTQDNERVADSADWFAGMFLLMPTRVFAALGGFDERFHLYCEDYDFCVRVRLSGKSLLLNDRHAVIHNAQRSSHRDVRYLFWHLRSLMIVWCSNAFWRYTFKRMLGKLAGVSRLEASCQLPACDSTRASADRW